MCRYYRVQELRGTLRRMVGRSLSGRPGRRRNVTQPDPLEHAFAVLDRAPGQRPLRLQPRPPKTRRVETVECGIPCVGRAIALETHDAFRCAQRRLAGALVRLS